MDLSTMMRDQARAGLNAALDAAVTNGDTEGARKITKDLEALAVSTAPKAPPYGDVEIKGVLDTKAPWFGTDPKKSAKALQFGKDMDPKKFASAEAFADAIIKAVDEDFKPASAAGDVDPDEEDADEGAEDEDADDKTATTAKKPRKTDGPGEGDAGGRSGTRRTAGPWTKLADAPPATQAEIKRQADKFVPVKAPKEQREKFISNALSSHYAAHQRAKGKK